MKEKTPEAVKEYLDRHKLTKHAANMALRLTMYGLAYYHFGFNSETRKMIKDPEQRVGMLEGSIIAPRLCYPDAGIGSLIFEQAQAGQLLSYDFKRPEEFPLSVNSPTFSQISEGSLWISAPDSIRDHPADKKTLIDLNYPLSIDNVLTADKRYPDDLVDEGMLIRTTHAEAYESVGATDYIDDLRARSVDREPVYQVTPKGNTVMHLMPDGGDTTPKTNPEPKLAHLPGLLAH